MAEMWTPERVDQLKAFVADGLTYLEISKQMGLTKNACLGKAHRLGLYHPNSPPKTSAPLAIKSEFPPSGHCLWSFGNVGDAEFRFCGEWAARPGEAWCAEHRARVYIKPSVALSAGDPA